MRHALPVVVAAALVSAAVAQDKPEVEIKLDRRLHAGDKLKVTEDTDESNKIAVKEPDGKQSAEEHQEQRSLEYEREVIAIERNTVVTKERRTFSKFRIKRGKEEDKSLEGKTIIIQRGGTNEALVEDGASPGSLALDYMASEKEREVEQELPDNPFAPPAKLAQGATWKFDLKKFIAGLGSPLAEASYDHKASSGEGKLEKVFDRDGARTAEMSVGVKLKCRGFGGADFVEGGILEVKGSFEACIDGTKPDFALDLAQTFSGKVKAEAADPDKGTQEITYVFDTKVKFRRALIQKK
jgi:hypothetical protein